MPKILEANGCRFFFFSNEGLPRERCHIHIRKGSSLAKYWLEPYISLESSYGFSSGDLRWIETYITENADLLRRAWDEYFC